MVNEERLLKTFLDLVTIDSPSGEEGSVAYYVVGKLTDLGIAATRDAAGNVLARVEGEGESIMLNAHMDNVMPCIGINPIIENGVIRSDGRTVLGADDKAGLSQILEVLQVLKESNSKHPALELVITTREEIGLEGAKEFDSSWSKAKFGVVLDTGGAINNIAVRAPGANRFDITITGKAAHSGVAPEMGINAVVAAARAITRMKLGRLDIETTANIGTIHGGTARNIVPEKVQMIGEARSHSVEKLKRQTDEMVNAVEESAKEVGAQADIDLKNEFTAFNIGENSPVVQRIIKAGRSLGMTMDLKATGGGSDANVFNLGKIPTVIMSAGYENPHTTSESITVSNLVLGGDLLLAFVTGQE